MIKINDVINSAAKDIEEKMKIEIYNKIAKEFGLPPEYLEEKSYVSVIESNLQYQLWKKQFQDLFNIKQKGD